MAVSMILNPQRYSRSLLLVPMTFAWWETLLKLRHIRNGGPEKFVTWPVGFFADDYDRSLSREDILSGQRDIEIIMICDRNAPWRMNRVDSFASAFPQGAYYGEGWPKGFLPEAERVPILQRSRIGINIHNSTGPINFRTYYLPANGVMQICDNKSHLRCLFELNKEVIGFDNIDEAVELCRYYLTHDEERRQIAAAGWERALRDYNEVACFRLMLRYVEELSPSLQKRVKVDMRRFLEIRRRQTKVPRAWYCVAVMSRVLYKVVAGILSVVYRFLQSLSGGAVE